ncbi:uncharacterized protein BJ212DRAFT_1482122 [Suillus subaureus]|uniref:Uncharacterized protein n=1 Tax=Suillus subaureus TaxID=48587 RepID=A0A9P7E918_9AGAM|nr:uncharacterized protein BJ212DRAFT_1482122 [Suillus subaureus]KAG1814387.1 hypothetical protein BJ212DRAFT_1482122 [Suillus subaureus]
MSKALFTDTEDKDQDQLPGLVIILPKWSKTIEPVPVASPKSKRSTQGVKKQSEVTIGPMPDKGEGKAKAAKITDLQRLMQRPMFMTHPARATSAQQPAHTPLKSKATSASKPRAHSRNARATSQACPATPILESKEEAVKDTDALVPAAEAADINADINARKPTNINAEMQDVVTSNQPDPIALEDDFPADHWLEPTSNNMPLGIPSPTPAANHVSFHSASLPPTISNVHKHVLALAAQVAAMQMVDQDALTRVNAMERDFETHMLSMHAEFSQMQQDVGHTVTVVDSLVGLVKKLHLGTHCQQSILPGTDHQQPWSYCGHHAGASLGHGVFEQSLLAFSVILMSKAPPSHPAKLPQSQHLPVLHWLLLRLDHVPALSSPPSAAWSVP